MKKLKLSGNYPKIVNLTAKDLLLLIFICLLFSGKKDNNFQTQDNLFKLSSPAIGADSLLPVTYTCDGKNLSLPLKWTGDPSNTACFAIIMHRVELSTDIHSYWIIYNIPSKVNSLPENAKGIGIMGVNSITGSNSYSPPCSLGSNAKAYILTIYALSEMVKPNVAPDKVTMEVLLKAIKGIIISHANMKVWYPKKNK